MERGYFVRAQVREVIVAAVMLFLVVEAGAQEEGQAEVQPAVEAAAEARAATEALERGQVRHERKASLGANISLSSNDNVVGQVDGSSQTYGVNMEAGFQRITKRSEWRRDFSLVGATTRTPSVPKFIKSKDELNLSSIYFYSLESRPNVGPYVKASAKSPLFKGEDVRPDVVTYRFLEADGSMRTALGDSVRLTDPLRPAHLTGSVGALYRPIQEPGLKVETRLGLAGMRISANGQYAVKEVNEAGEVVLEALSSVEQAGVEAVVTVEGRLQEKSTYQLSLEALTPLINNAEEGDDRSAWELTNIIGSFKLTSPVTSWAALTYDYQLKLQPQLVRGPQQSHMLLLSLNYSLFE